MKKKLKIGVWILSDYKPHIGGGFSLYEKIIQLTDDYQFSDELEVCFIGHNPKSNYNFKKEYLCIDSFSTLPFLSKQISKYSHKINFIGKRECERLKDNEVDLIYYPVQGFKKVANFPFVTANWDIGHKTTFAFPEVAMNNTFDYRERWYAKEIHKALMVFAESEAGKEELVFYTKCNPERIGIVPLFPGGVVDVNASEETQRKKLVQNNLQSKQFFFYPAQFWAHKNHYNLLLAFKKIALDFPNIKLVLTGSDKGNKNYIEQTVKNLGLDKQVLILGFIDNESMFSLYKHAVALVMPTFLGPTNMPLLEARALNCPVLCSDFIGHKEIMNDGALYFKPSDYNTVYEAMEKILITGEREKLLAKANVSLVSSDFTAPKAMKALNENFLKLKAIRLCWGKNDKIF